MKTLYHISASFNKIEKLNFIKAPSFGLNILIMRHKFSISYSIGDIQVNLIILRALVLWYFKFNNLNLNLNLKIRIECRRNRETVLRTYSTYILINTTSSRGINLNILLENLLISLSSHTNFR